MARKGGGGWILRLHKRYRTDQIASALK